MKPIDALSDLKHPDMSPEAIDKRLRDLAQIYKLGMSLRDAKWLGPVNAPVEDRTVPVSSATSPPQNASLRNSE